MKRLPLFRMMIVAVAVAAGCSSPSTRIGTPARGPAWKDTGTPPATIALRDDGVKKKGAP